MTVSEMLCRVIWLAFSFSSILCGVAARKKEVEECLMYRVESGLPSPVYELQDNQDTLLKVFDYFDDGSNTRILDGDSCLLLLREDSARKESSNCQKTLESIRGYFKMEFTNRGEEVIIQREAGGRFQTLFKGTFGSLKTLRVETDSSKGTAVVFGCPSGCFELENALFYHDFTIFETLAVFGRKIERDGEVDALVKFTTHSTIPLYNYLSGPWTEINKLLSNDCWYSIDLKANYTFHPQLSYSIELYGSFQSFPGELKYLAYAPVDSFSYVLLDFVHCKGIRWRFCEPQHFSGSLPRCSSSTTQEEGCVTLLYFYITLPIWGILFLLIIAITVTTYRLRRLSLGQENAANAKHHAYDDVAVPTMHDVRRQVSQGRNPTFISSEEDEHIYEEIPEPFSGNRNAPVYLQPL